MFDVALPFVYTRHAKKLLPEATEFCGRLGLGAVCWMFEGTAPQPWQGWNVRLKLTSTAS
jgi:hypothetical protein